MSSREFRNELGSVLNRFGGRSMKPALDPNDICFEVYNPGKEEITFTSYHVLREEHFFFNRPPRHWMQLKCKPGEWLFLPHGYYIGTVPSGSKEITVTKNFGDQMFVGNKYPSAPEVRRKFVKGGTTT